MRRAVYLLPEAERVLITALFHGRRIQSLVPHGTGSGPRES